jgi:hypothetical protein
MDSRSFLLEQFNSSLTENFFHESTADVFEKYEIVEELKMDELGPINKVKPKDPAAIRIYSLKTIYLNRVSRIDLHQEQLKNEIIALKVCLKQ